MGRPKKRKFEDQETQIIEENESSNSNGNGSSTSLLTNKENNVLGLSFHSSIKPDVIVEIGQAGHIQIPNSNARDNDAVPPPLSSDGGLTKSSDENNINNTPHSEMQTVRQSCACLSTIYLELSDLNSLDNFAFPAALHPLQKAMSTTRNAIECSACPENAISALQNLHLVITLLYSIAERFQKMARTIISDAATLRKTGKARELQFCDTTSNSPVHATDTGRSVSFNLELHAEEWQQMANSVIRSNVKHLPNQGSDASLEGLLLQLEARQARWHTDDDMIQRMSETQPESLNNLPMKDFLCMRMLDSVRSMISKI